MKLAAALWRVRPGDHPRPAALTRDLRWDVLSLNQQLGLCALGLMQVQGLQVGPVLSCTIHGLVHIPVTPWTGSPLGRGLSVRPFDTSCPRDGPWSYADCAGRMWLLPPRPEDEVVLTDFVEVFHEIHRVRCGAS
ncbi:hypothetical protein ACFXJ5_09385 [Streptomyces sp. NPDC059373]